MKAPIKWHKGKGGWEGGVERVLCHCCKNSRLFPKYEGVQHGWYQSFEQLFPRICWDGSLESVKCGKELFFRWDSLKNTVLHKFQQEKNLYLLTEWEGWTENIWVEVMTYGPSAATSVRHDRVPIIFPSCSNKLSP